MKSFDEMSDEEIAEFNMEQAEETAAMYKEFKTDLEAGKCWVCKDALNSFDESKPCQHWLIMPTGFRKKHFKILFEAKTYDKLEGFLRWYVNAHAPAQHINDLREEHDGNKLRAFTISYENLEWSFSFAKGCLKGEDGPHGPHYHFQMRIGGRPFHDYSNRHIKLSDYELWLLQIEVGKHPKIIRREVHGIGMQGIFDQIETSDLLSHMKSTEDYENAPFQVQSLVMADEGSTISGDDIADLMEESKRTGVPMYQLIKKLKNVTSTVIVSPGPGVPEAAQRKLVRRKDKKTT